MDREASCTINTLKRVQNPTNRWHGSLEAARQSDFLIRRLRFEGRLHATPSFCGLFHQVQPPGSPMTMNGSGHLEVRKEERKIAGLGKKQGERERERETKRDSEGHEEKDGRVE